jgi:hypothetical protein
MGQFVCCSREGVAVGIAKQKINKDFGIDSLAKAKLEPTEQLGKTSHTVSMQEKTGQAKRNAAEEESKKPVPMSNIGLYKVLYIGKTLNTAETPEDEKP